MLYREIIAICSQIHIKRINKLCGQNVELLNVQPGGTYIYRCASGQTFTQPAVLKQTSAPSQYRHCATLPLSNLHVSTRYTQITSRPQSSSHRLLTYQQC